MKRTLHYCLLLAGLLLAGNGFAQTLEERIVNGDFEGSDYSSFAINVKPRLHLLQILRVLSSLSD